jgi:hypothetical protein
MILSETHTRDELAKQDMQKTELQPKCPYYQTKRYSCRKHFPPCVNELTQSVQLGKSVVYNPPGVSPSAAMPAVIQYKICQSACMAARDNNNGACKWFNAAYFENECSQSRFYDQDNYMCEQFDATVTVDQLWITKIIIALIMGTVGMALASSLWSQQREAKKLRAQLDKTDFEKPSTKKSDAAVSQMELKAMQQKKHATKPVVGDGAWERLALK